MTHARSRLDLHLVKTGTVDTREAAREAILEHRVLVNGAFATKPAQQVRSSDAVRLVEAKRFVSRAGLKLDNALREFDVSVEGLECLDVGLSTGGFSECLLRRGVKSVVGVDVGTHQVHERLLGFSNFSFHEQTDVREFAKTYSGRGFDLITCDVSFISITKLTHVLASLLREDYASLIVLIKPQFELDKIEVSRGKGVIKSSELWRKAIDLVVASFRSESLYLAKIAPAHPRGTSGNQEFLSIFTQMESTEVGVSEAIEKAVKRASDASTAKSKGELL
ncbi:23S rRNA (cytidine1920-2'-O)/16S rRNA (cytidine1409-2'-O)-methyltransferase [Ferrithrix thermotolerans DSM 19514]|uniref:23S rRNA (Cytidine1920-2'-O)/16S rRNA (Cytidine1409-2'-O)-methyltransferase n=1 Tax=Ferrithrix thermotolerans DSM 19514 TaxID=1121881 RepID=A0A1M4XC48_9ACTN|nr:TlyA family RNA methyltransferase [Ferrithrix thermotolerans]SHE90762.1 23S rRNA (cytidine1920-2'-O)/16S rRNA (cytidine1409-2'-O)-methyltransferase [Ferrithrix thermotolerans DSM 19514]